MKEILNKEEQEENNLILYVPDYQKLVPHLTRPRVILFIFKGGRNYIN